MGNIKAVAWLLLWLAFIFACSLLIPYFSNDFRYMLIEGTDDLVGSLLDVFVSQYRHYFDWGGRTPAHVTAQILLYAGKPFSAMSNAVCYVLLTVLIYAHAFGVYPNPLKFKTLPLIFISLSLWMFTRVFGEVVFMVVSSCNYMYTTTFILAFLLPYRLSIHRHRREGSAAFAVLMFFAGVIAGWCNENTGFAVCVGVGALGLYLLKYHRLTLWQVTGGIGLGIGYLILVVAPGNEARLDFMKKGGFNYWDHITGAFGIIGYTLLVVLPLLVIIAYLIFKIHKLKLVNPKDTENQAFYDYLSAWWLFGIGLLSLLIMIFSPNFPARSTVPFTFFSIAAAAGFYSVLNRKGVAALTLWQSRLLLALGLVFTVATAQNALRGYITAYEDFNVRQKSIMTQLNEGKKDLVVEPFRVKTSRYIFIGEVRKDKDYFANLILSRFYHVNSIRRSCDYKSKGFLDFVFLQDFGKPVCTAVPSDTAKSK